MKTTGWLLIAALGATACNDSKPPESPGKGLSECLDPPATLERPPSGLLPCELLPPGFSQ
jgi:hypothetical protein